MRISFSGFEEPLSIECGKVSVLEVVDCALFARLCQALHSELGENALEPYAIWNDEGKRVRPDKVFVCAFNPFDLPWNDKALLKAVIERIEDMFVEDDQTRQTVESTARSLSECLEGLGLAFQSDYVFDTEWNIKDHLRAFDFTVDVDSDDTLFDSLMKFLKLAEDALFDGALCFVNLKTFLSEGELKDVYEQVFFSKLRVLLLENVCDSQDREYEEKMHIDQGFLQI